MMKLTEIQLRRMIREIIKKIGDQKYRIYSKKKGKDGKRKNLGTFTSKAAAKKREKQIQYFKHKGG